MRRSKLAAVIAALVAACSKSTPEQGQAPSNPPSTSTAPAKSNAPVPPRGPSPQGPTIDPKSNAAAEELVRGFVRLINGGKLDDAYMLLGPNAPPRADFDNQFAGYSNLRATSGSAGGQEGAAGSIYVSVPLTVSGDRGGRHVERSASAVLRRVNDVPGSTETQRHWHIERIDWK